MNWNQAICERCWAERNPGRVPVRMPTRSATVETCSYCAGKTDSGIFVPDHPDRVPYPQPEAQP